MLSPVFRKVFDKILFVCQNTGVYNTHYCSLIRMSEPKWKTEKYSLLKLGPDDKRKAGLYDGKTVVSVDTVDPWHSYVIRNKSIENERKHTLDDLTEFKKIKIDSEQNKLMSEKVSLFRGDITHLEVSAIVNAANSRLKAGGGVDGAIHRAAGSLLQDECNTLGGCPTGEAKITCGYNLPATYVIHTVGPQDGNATKLRQCYENSLAFHKSHKLTSIAFPCISTGIYGFRNRLAAHIALGTARKFLEQNPDMERIIFCLFMPIDVEIYETLMQMYFPVHEWNYNDDARLLMGLPRYCSASGMFADAQVDGFYAIIRKRAASLMQRVKGSPNSYQSVISGYIHSPNWRHWIDVIHTVGPQDGNATKLRQCYENSLAFHKSHKLTSIAFPCISTGIYGFPNRLAAHIALGTARKFLEQNPDMERIIFCLFMPIDVEIYETLMQMYFPVHEWNYNDDARSE